MTKLNYIKEYLETHEKARERANRYKALVAIIKRDLNLDNISISDSTLEEIISLGMTYNRSINRIQQLYPELRGTDYKDKKTLQQKAQLEQGYEPGFYQDKKLFI